MERKLTKVVDGTEIIETGKMCSYGTDVANDLCSWECPDTRGNGSSIIQVKVNTKEKDMFRHEDFVKVQQVVNVFDVKETEINLTEFKKKVHEEHINDVERVKNYKVYYERVYAETGTRPSKFQPEEGYTLQKYKVKGVDIELLSPGRKTKRVICFFKGCGFSNYMTDAANRETSG